MSKYPDYDGTQNCMGMPTEVFYLADDDINARYKEKDLNTLRSLCADCKFLEPCFVYALHHERYGFWAGTTQEERRRLRKQKGIRLVDRSLGTREMLPKRKR